MKSLEAEDRLMKTDSLKVSGVVPAGPEAVYKAWLNNKQHGEMTETPAARITARVGGKFTAGGGYMRGSSLALDPARKIPSSRRTSRLVRAQSTAKAG